MKGKTNGGQLCAERGDHFRWDFPRIVHGPQKQYQPDKRTIATRLFSFFSGEPH